MRQPAGALGRGRPLAEHQLRLWSYSSWSSVQSSHKAMSYLRLSKLLPALATALLTICVTLGRAASFTVTLRQKCR